MNEAGQPPAPEGAGQPAAILPRAPYPGLRPFEPDEWMIFFGREVMIADVIERLAFQHLVFIHGASGSGKSSLVRAGVLPKLARQPLGIPWATAILRPSGGPLWNLAGELARLEGRAGEVERISEIIRLFNKRGASLAGIVASLDRLAGKNICILIDQFEELFRFERETSREEAELFISLLIDLIPQPADEAEDESDVAPARAVSNLYVIITMRSEFLGECARFDRFAEAINRAQYLVPRLTRAALLRSIRYPARNYGGVVTVELAERLITEVRGKPDELPLIQHGLMVLWEEASAQARSPDGKIILDREMIDAKGGLAKCLSDHAEAVLQDAAPDAARQGKAERIFRALTDINAEGQAIRRPLAFGLLPELAQLPAEAVRTIIDKFRAEGVCFLSPYKPAPIEDETRIDISHEALIRCWDSLNKWVRAEALAAARYRELVRRAKRWDGGRHGLLTGDDLRDAWAWWNSGDALDAWAKLHGGDFERVRNFITASKAHEEKLQNQKRAWKYLARGSVGVIVAAGLILLFLYQQSQIRSSNLRDARQKELQQDLSDESKAAALLKQGRAFEAQANPDYKSAFAAFQQAAAAAPAPNAIAAGIELGRLNGCLDSDDLHDDDQCTAEKAQGLKPKDAAAKDEFDAAWQATQTQWSPQQKFAWQNDSSAAPAQLAAMHGEAALLAGLVYNHNLKDLQDAVNWYGRAENQPWKDDANGISDATAFYYHALLQNSEGGDNADQKTMALLQRASQEGLVAAESEIASILDGEGKQTESERHYANVLQRTLQGQEGSIESAYKLGMDCLNGNSSDCDASQTGAPHHKSDKPDYGVAMFLFRQAATMREAQNWMTRWDGQMGANAEYEIGRMYFYGLGVPKNGYTAYLWCNLALTHDTIDPDAKANAEYFIGSVLYDDPDVQTDYAMALQYLQQANADGTDFPEEATVKIGIIYATGGNGVSQDTKKAAAAFAKAISETQADIKANSKDDAGLDRLAMEYLVTGQWQRALAAINTALAISNLIPYQLSKADALMMLNQTGAARTIYLSHQGDLTDDGDGVAWQQDVLSDIATLRRLGFKQPLMDEITTRFGAEGQ